MQNEHCDSDRDISEGDKSELGADMVEPHVTTFMCRLDLKTKKKLFAIMIKNDHILSIDTFQMLIDCEYNRIQESDNAPFRF